MPRKHAKTISLFGLTQQYPTDFGGKENNKRNSKKIKVGRGAVGKQDVLSMKERSGRVKAIPIDNADQETLQNAIHKNVVVGSTVFTDEHRGAGLDGLFYNHQSG